MEQQSHLHFDHFPRSRRRYRFTLNESRNTDGKEGIDHIKIPFSFFEEKEEKDYEKRRF